MGFASAAITAVIVGIFINALALQRERHPAPFFSAAPVAPTAAPKAAPEAAAPDAPALAPVASPPVRPAGLGAAATSLKSADPIADMLRGASNRDTQRLLATAQASLVKLGYSIKNNGVLGADTINALREFERSRHLPVSGDLTQRIVKQLVDASNAQGAR